MRFGEAMFVTTWLAGIVSLVSAMFVARLRWRNDVPPFGRHSQVFDIALHPEKYAAVEALPLIRRLGLLGAALMAIGVLMLAWEFVAALAIH
jgi:hypothetical protein